MQSRKETGRLIVAMVLVLWTERRRGVLAGKENQKWSRTMALSVGIGPKEWEAQYSTPNERGIWAWAVPVQISTTVMEW
jgi:hypothetical protein